ncbi:MAG: exodeoxyribonuclease V subunit alpha [Chthoniobacterales bacterium]|nr:exodeoxyribonuclease V subunit alpha [Chthoniobacterales bacterium]
MNPDLFWLQSRWHLPDSRTADVLRHLEEERRGGTASPTDGADADWGAAAGTPDAPLVLVPWEGQTFLQSRRLFRAESKIARDILRLAESTFPAAPSELLDRLFPDAAADDRQRAAARMAASRSLALITGGPGTGKTHTLARILLLLTAGGISADRIRLAAPTGKAADRMKKAVTDSLDGLDPSVSARRSDLARIAASSSTLHALLGYHPGTGRCRFDARNPLSCAVLIVDECSMVDVLLWRALLAALPADARLILLGDPNQLESVGQGNVFAELARIASSGGPLTPCHVHLTEARRFRERPAILELSRALERSDAEAAVHLLSTTAPSDGVSWIPTTGGLLPCAKFPPDILAALEAVAVAATPAAALEALGGVCVLTAQREFFVGAKAVSAAIDAFLSARPGTRNHPIIINRNDPETGLRNGTVGVFHRDDHGAHRAFFPSVRGGLEEISAAKLPDHSPAWAITIHRSQGSEYDSVLVILPQEKSPMTTRELLYTAITRARKHVHIVGTLDGVRKAVLTPSSRRTLLAAHLATASGG